MKIITLYLIGNARTCWVTILTIKDMANVLPSPMGGDLKKLQLVWRDNWQGL
jgi:hypothetical protein